MARSAVLLSLMIGSLSAFLLSYPDLPQPQSFIIETKQIIIPEYPIIFNPSVMRWQGQLLMSFRIRAGQTTHKIGLVQLNEKGEPEGKPSLLTIKYPNPLPFTINSKKGEQDPRFITIGDELFMVYSHFRLALVLIARVTCENGEFIAHEPQLLSEFEGKIAGRSEKNWTPFEYNNEMHLIYSICPQKILVPLKGTQECQTLCSTPTEFNWPWGELRGGTQALKIDDHYLSFFHTRSKWRKMYQDRERLVEYYFMGAYTFDAQPPFKVTQVSPEPIIADNFYSPHSYKLYKPLLCIFPCGFMHDENYIWVFYGRHDNEAWYVKLDKKGLYQSLKKV